MSGLSKELNAHTDSVVKDATKTAKIRIISKNAGSCISTGTSRLQGRTRKPKTRSNKSLRLDKMPKLVLEEIEDLNKYVFRKLKRNQRPSPNVMPRWLCNRGELYRSAVQHPTLGKFSRKWKKNNIFQFILTGWQVCF